MFRALLGEEACLFRIGSSQSCAETSCAETCKFRISATVQREGTNGTAAVSTGSFGTRGNPAMAAALKANHGSGVLPELSDDASLPENTSPDDVEGEQLCIC
mmetsp:Transcript_117468/g.184742  ORF Transcript_117468/g.184742 Transcript_117468/m.184742 type:complete len:102 (+) Transcript_117468:1863-2168(+)